MVRKPQSVVGKVGTPRRASRTASTHERPVRRAGRATLRSAPVSGAPSPEADARSVWFGVTRVSTEDQATNGHSLDAQDAALTEEADRRKVDLKVVPIPGRSGKAMSPELREVLDRLAAGEAQGLMVTKIDRLTRSVSVASDIITAAQGQGWNLVIADLGIDLSTWQGRAMAHMLATFAEVERELISQRTKEGIAAARAKNVQIGRPPLVPEHIAAEIRQRHAEGWTFAEIARGLTEAGIQSPAGRPVWISSTVRRIALRGNKTRSRAA